MLKKFTLVLFTCFIALSFSACEKSSDDDNSGSSGNAALAGKVNLSVYSLMGQAMTGATGGASKVVAETPIVLPVTFTYPGEGWSASGTYEATSGSTTWDIDITFNSTGYDTGEIVIKDGTLNISGSVNDTDGTFSYTYDGDFNVVYNSVTYTIGWLVTGSYDRTNYTFSGTYTLNGTESSFSYSGITK